MIKFYVARIQLGKMELEDIPEKYRDAVEVALNA